MPVPAGPGTATSGVCTPWVDPAAVAARADMADVTAAADTVNTACLTASTLLYDLSGRQFPGICTATVRPYAPPYGCNHLSAFAGAVNSGRLTLDSWTIATQGGVCCPGGIDLGLYPIRAVLQVKINGLVVDPATYRVDDQRWLVRPNVQFWPTWQRLDLPDSADSTFSVTVQYGTDPPPHGVTAASRMAAELVKEWTPGATSALPRRVTSITRQAVTTTAFDPMTFLTEGGTGIYEVDLFIRSANPARQIAPPLVWSPDLPRRRRTV